MVYLVDPSQRGAAERYIANHRARKGLPLQPVIIRQALYDFNQLKEWRDQFLPIFVTIDKMVSVDIDEARNQLNVGVEEAAAIGTVRHEMARLGIPNAAVHVVVEQKPVPLRLGQTN